MKLEVNIEEYEEDAVKGHETEMVDGVGVAYLSISR